VLFTVPYLTFTCHPERSEGPAVLHAPSTVRHRLLRIGSAWGARDGNESAWPGLNHADACRTPTLGSRTGHMSGWAAPVSSGR